MYSVKYMFLWIFLFKAGLSFGGLKDFLSLRRD